MWGLRPDLLRPSPKRALATASAHGRGEGRVPRGGHLSPPRLALDKCHVGLKAGFTPAVSQAGPFQPPPRVAEERGGFRGGGHLSRPPIALAQCHVGVTAGFGRAASQRCPSPPLPAPAPARGGRCVR